VEADVFAPCALGGVISAETLDGLGAAIVAGSANNQLLRHEDGLALARRGILYAPDYVINAGGLIDVADELEPGGYDRARVLARIEAIPTVLAGIFLEADRSGRATHDVALDMAMARIAARRGQAQ
jgi:leucine dehydrogenase